MMQLFLLTETIYRQNDKYLIQFEHQTVLDVKAFPLRL